MHIESLGVSRDVGAGRAGHDSGWGRKEIGIFFLFTNEVLMFIPTYLKMSSKMGWPTLFPHV